MQRCGLFSPDLSLVNYLPVACRLHLRPGSPAWFHQVWALMMILSEIAEWKPLVKGSAKNEEELLKMKLDRKRLVKRPQWKGCSMA